MLLSIFAMGLIAGTTSLGTISPALASTGIDLVRPALFLASAAFFISTMAENARVPVDNPTTHLELTMIHEAMILEYSGKQLALMELSRMTRLVLSSYDTVERVLPLGDRERPCPPRGPGDRPRRHPGSRCCSWP